MFENGVGYIFIFFARVVDVTLGTLRVLLVVRGKKFWAASIGFFEVIIYVLALKFVVDSLSDPISLIFYAFGFAGGNVVGSFVEEKMAMGILTVEVITLERPEELTAALREEGFGVTVLEGMGRQGIRHVLHIILSRKDLTKLMGIIDNWDDHAFVTVLDARTTRGGFFLRKKAK